MAHALREFIRKQMDERRIDQATFTRTSGLGRSHVSKLLRDNRERLPQIPRRETLEGIAKAFNVSEQVVLAVAIEALGLGWKAADFVYELSTATNEELTREVERRMQPVSVPHHGSVVPGGSVARGISTRLAAGVDVEALVVTTADEDHVSQTNLYRLLKRLRDQAVHSDGRVDISPADRRLLEAAQLELERVRPAGASYTPTQEELDEADAALNRWSGPERKPEPASTDETA